MHGEKVELSNRKPDATGDQVVRDCDVGELGRVDVGHDAVQVRRRGDVARVDSDRGIRCALSKADAVEGDVDAAIDGRRRDCVCRRIEVGTIGLEDDQAAFTVLSSHVSIDTAASKIVEESQAHEAASRARAGWLTGGRGAGGRQCVL